MLENEHRGKFCLFNIAFVKNKADFIYEISELSDCKFDRLAFDTYITQQWEQKSFLCVNDKAEFVDVDSENIKYFYLYTGYKDKTTGENIVVTFYQLSKREHSLYDTGWLGVVVSVESQIKQTLTDKIYSKLGIPEEEKENVRALIISTLKKLQADSDAWVDISSLVAPLSFLGIKYKNYGYEKLRNFLDEFDDILEFRKEHLEGKFSSWEVKFNHYFKNTLTEEEKNLNYSANLLSNKRPPRKEGKDSVWAFGYIGNFDNSLEILSKMVGYTVTADMLKENIEKSYSNNKILYFEYNDYGNLEEKTFFSDKTISFAIKTRFKDNNNLNIYAQFVKSKNGWIGCYFKPKKTIWRQLNAYTIGVLSFVSYLAANDFIRDFYYHLLGEEIWKSNIFEFLTRKRTEYPLLETYLGIIMNYHLKQYISDDTNTSATIKFSADKKQVSFYTGLKSDDDEPVYITADVLLKNNGTKFVLCNPQISYSAENTIFNDTAFIEDTKTEDDFYLKNAIHNTLTNDWENDDIERLYLLIIKGIQQIRDADK